MSVCRQPSHRLKPLQLNYWQLFRGCSLSMPLTLKVHGSSMVHFERHASALEILELRTVRQQDWALQVYSFMAKYFHKGI